MLGKSCKNNSLIDRCVAFRRYGIASSWFYCDATKNTVVLIEPLMFHIDRFSKNQLPYHHNVSINT